MHDQTTLGPAERQGQLDSAILGLLMMETSHRPWSFDEIAREIGEKPTDSLNRLLWRRADPSPRRLCVGQPGAVMADEIGSRSARHVAGLGVALPFAHGEG